MASGTYRLDLEPQKKNIFVTQLNEREDEDVIAYPVVKESPSHLIETGLNTLQRTLLLKKEVQVDRVSRELADKRAEFKARMDKCAMLQVEAQKKQQKMRDRVNKFEKFIKENEMKRRRAIQKYQMEVRLKEQKKVEFESLQQQVEELKIRHSYLKNKLARYKVYEEYLMKVVDVLPAHYLEASDSMINGLMMRHRTLSDTNHSLMDNLLNMADELEKKRQELEEMRANHNKMKLSINSQLSMMKKSQEVAVDQNEEHEQRFVMGKVNFRRQMSDLGLTIMAINNLSEKCHRRLDPELDGLTLYNKLDIIKGFVVDSTDIVNIASKMEGSISFPDSKKHTSLGRSTKT